MVGGVLNQGVLETVDGVGRAAAPKHELRGDELVEPALQLLSRPVGDCGDELVGELAADHSADLGKLLDRGQPVEPRHQRIVQVRRDSALPANAFSLSHLAGVGPRA